MARYYFDNFQLLEEEKQLFDGEKQIPPGVRRALYVQKISRKRSEYQKRITKKRKQADEMMYAAEVEVPSVEALMACPITKFIHFAANDCGYNGSVTELTFNWIHLLFLKAKATTSQDLCRLHCVINS